MHGLAVLLIPFAVMAFALGMERLQAHLDVAAPEADVASADLADSDLFVDDMAVTPRDAAPSADSGVNHLRRAS